MSLVSAWMRETAFSIKRYRLKWGARRSIAIGVLLLSAIVSSSDCLYAVDVQTFVPYADNNPVVSVLGASAYEAKECWLGTYVNHVRRPSQGSDNSASATTVQSLRTASIAPSCGLTSSLSLLAHIPVHWSEANAASDGTSRKSRGQVGDANLLLRWNLSPRLMPYAGGSLALAPFVKLGHRGGSSLAGDSIGPLSDGAWSGGLKFLYDYYLTPRHYLAANVDYFHRRDQTLLGHKLGDELRLDMAYSYLLEALSGLSAFAEWHMRQPVVMKPDSSLAMSREWLFGFSAKPFGDSFGIFVGGGRGIGNGYGASEARLFAGIEVSINKPAPPFKPFVESEIPPTEISSAVSPGSIRLSLRGSKRRDVSFSLRGGPNGHSLSGTVLGGGPYFQGITPGVYTLHVRASGVSNRSRQLVVTPGVTSLVEVTPLTSGDISIVNRLEVPAIQFENKKAIIKSQSFADLDRIAKIMRDSDAIKLLAIEGHTDNVGARERNLKLSLERANAVENYLIDKGVDPRRLTTKGFGPDYPIESNAKDFGRSRNRRVEFVINSAAMTH